MNDVNALRDPEIAMYGLDTADEIYTFYYDETNNIRRLHVTPKPLIDTISSMGWRSIS
jgi:hypothetical protein